jgi:hypothetical protein
MPEFDAASDGERGAVKGQQVLLDLAPRRDGERLAVAQ